MGGQGAAGWYSPTTAETEWVWGGAHSARLATASVKWIRAIAKGTSICVSILRKLKIRIDMCKIRLSSEPGTTGNCNLSSGCCACHEWSRKQAPSSYTVSGFSAPSPTILPGFSIPLAIPKVSNCINRSLFLFLAYTHSYSAISEQRERSI